MRAIKYRAWDKEEKYMVESTRSLCTIIQHKMEIPQAGGWSEIDTTPKPEKYILMQSIGKKDIKGIEAYEGDIVVVFDSFGDKVVDQLCVIEWYDENCCFVARHIGKKYPAYFCWKIEVVGNIHENEEMLGVEYE